MSEALTPTQRHWLKVAAAKDWPAPGVITARGSVMPRGRASWRRMMMHLVKLGLFERMRDDGREFRITDAGRAAIEGK